MERHAIQMVSKVTWAPGKEVIPGKVVLAIDCYDSKDGFVCKVLFTDGTSLIVVDPEELKI